MYNTDDKLFDELLKLVYEYSNNNKLVDSEVYARMRSKDIKILMEQVTSLDERIMYGLPISIEEYNRKFNGDIHNLKV